MVQSYSDITQQQKSLKSARIINQNPNLEQEQLDQTNRMSKEKVINDYISEKVKEGFMLESDGSLSKTSGSTTTTVTVNRSTGEVSTRTTTVKTKKTKSSQLDKIDKDIKRRQSTIDAYYRGKVEASPSTIQSLKNQLNKLYEARNNLTKTGTAFVTVETPVTQESSSSLDIVTDVKGNKYSVAPVNQESFLKKVNVQNDSRIVQGTFTAPRTVNASETSNVSSPVQINVPVPQPAREPAGVMNARKIGEFSSREFGSNEPVANRVEASAIGNLRDSNLNPSAVLVASGVVSGVASIFKVENTLIEASNFNPNKVLQQETKSRILKGGLEVIKDPFKSLIVEPVERVVENPLFEAPKLVVELATLEGLGRTAKTVTKSFEVGGKDFRLGTAETLGVDSLTGVESTSLFLNPKQQLKGTVPFEPIPTVLEQKSVFGGESKGRSIEPVTEVIQVRQGTQSRLLDQLRTPEEKAQVSSAFNEVTNRPIGNNPFELNVLDTRLNQKNLLGTSAVDTAQKSQLSKAPKEPAIVEQQYTIGGKKTFGQSFRDDVGGQPTDLIESTQQSMSVVDELVISDTGKLSVESGVKLKPFNPDDVFKESTSLRSTDTGQKQSVSRLDTLSEKVGSSERKFEGVDLKGKSSSLAGSSQSLAGSGSSLSGSGQVLLLEPRPPKVDVQVDVVVDSSGNFVRKIGETELNLDIKGKVTTEKSGVGSIALLNTKTRTEVKPSNVLDLKSDTKTSQSLKQDSVSVQETGVKSDIKVLQFQSTGQTQTSVQVQQTRQSLDLKQLQGLKSKLTTETVQKIEPIKPLLPKLSTEKQVKSGVGLFNLLVKKQGKFVQIGSGYSDLPTAINRGKQELKNTASASFKIVSNFGVVSPNLKNDKVFRPSKVDPNVVVQKRQFRISSAGEKKEIQQKGVFLQRTRRGLRRAKKKGIFT